MPSSSTRQDPDVPAGKPKGDSRAIPVPVNRRPEVPFQSQHVRENSADFAHLKYVHKNAEMATVELHEPDGVRFRFRFGTTCLTPEAGEVPGALPGEWWGLGILVFNVLGVHDAAEIVMVTPIDQHHSDVRMSVTARREPGAAEPTGMALRIMRHQIKEIERDMRIWAHMRYLTRPVIALEEAPGFKRLRARGSQQFPRDGVNKVRSG